jgi:hypothetical protein
MPSKRKLVAILGHLKYNLLAFDFRVFRSTQFLRLPARDLPAEEPFQSFSATSRQRNIATPWKQEQ